MLCSEMTYHEAICYSMQRLAEQQNTVFLGQQVASEEFYGTLKGIPMDKRIEMPVAEDLQTGIALGMALEGFLPISIYQRMDFLPRAADQIVNHLNLIGRISEGRFNPTVILRVTIGATKPLDVGLQHNKDLVNMFKAGVQFPVVRVRTADEVLRAYEIAMYRHGPMMIVEEQDLYNA